MQSTIPVKVLVTLAEVRVTIRTREKTEMTIDFDAETNHAPLHGFEPKCYGVLFLDVLNRCMDTYLVVDSTPEINRSRWAVSRPFKLEESWDPVELFKSRIRLRRPNCINDKAQAAEICVTADDVVDK